MQRPGHVGERGQIRAVGGDDPAGDPFQIRVGVAQLRTTLTQILDQRKQVLRIERGQRIGSRRARQTRQIQLAAEVCAPLDQPQRARQRIKKREQQPQDQSIGKKFGVAMGRQLTQASEVLIEQPRRRVRQRQSAVLYGKLLRCWRWRRAFQLAPTMPRGEGRRKLRSC